LANQTLALGEVEQIFGKMKQAAEAFRLHYPGEFTTRQPVHTVYGGAHLFTAATAQKLTDIALRTMEENAVDFTVFARVLQLPGHDRLPVDSAEIARLNKMIFTTPSTPDNRDIWMCHKVFYRVIEKMRKEAIEDYRIDFEDGYGYRPDQEEDGHAALAAQEIAIAMQAKILPSSIGIRIKPLSSESRWRAARTLDLFVTALAERTNKNLPRNLIVTLPKVTDSSQVAALVELLRALERKLALRPETLKMELMIEQPQAIIDQAGGCAIPEFIRAGAGKCMAMHFGAYDFTSACNITAVSQTMDHAICDYARHAMQVALAGTGIWLSDGATNIIPVGPHKAPRDQLNHKQRQENQEVIHRAWKIGYDHIRRSLTQGFYQGWDLHPAQLPIRYAACYSFFYEGLEETARRLYAFTQKAAQASLVGDVFDDAATGQGLLNFFLRALNCGAITEVDLQPTGITVDEMRTRSFATIIAGRRRKI
jgi:citrate lyase beta subunit